MPLPQLNDQGDLPAGIHASSIEEVIDVFGKESPQRKIVGLRLRRIYELALSTGCLERALVFGSFVSAKSHPNDVDVFLGMGNEFNVESLAAGQRLLFENASAQAHFGASVF